MSSIDNYNPIKEKPQKRGWLAWISPQHRLVVIDDAQFKEERSMRLTWRNVLIIIGASIAIWLLSVLLMLRLFGGSTRTAAVAQEVANYTPDEMRQQLIAIHGLLDSLQSEIASRDIYIEKIQALLNSNLETEKDIKAKREQLAELDTTPLNKEMPAKNEAVERMIQTAEHTAEITDNQPVGLTSSDLAAGPRIDQFSFVPPLRGIVSDTFAPKTAHYGVDIVAPRGSVIKAAQSGTVVVATWSAETGHMLAVQHPNNLVSFYKHNSSLLKKMGDKVNAGEAIAIIGNSGEQTDGPHLHFEIWFHGQPVNPQKYVQF